MKTRHIDLLKMLIDQGAQFHTIAYYSEKVGCSNRTLRNDFKEVEELLRSHHLSGLEKKPGVGIRLKEPEETREIVQLIKRLEHTTKEMDAEERRFFVLYHLLMSKEAISIDALANMHYVSRPTIQKDLEQLKKTCYLYHCSIESIQHVGTGIKGREKDKRALLSYTLRSLRELDLKEKAILTFFDRSEVKIVTDAVNKCLSKATLNITDEAFESLKLHVLFMIKRLYLNQPIELTDKERNRIRGTDYYEWATEIVWEIQDHLTIQFPLNEVSYLALHLKSARVERVDDEHHDSNETPVWIEEIVEKLISEVSELLGVNLTKDMALRENVMLHFRTSITRLESGFIISNPLLNEIKQEYLYLFHFLKSTMDAFKESLPVDIPDEEIGYLTVHFQAAYERNQGLRETTFKVGIVCHYGLGVSAFIQAKLESTFSEIDETVILSERELIQPQNNQAVDVIVATIPIEVEGTPVYRISAMLKQEEMTGLRKLIRSISKESKKESAIVNWSLSNYSQPFLIHLQKELDSPNEVIHYMVDEMVKREYVYKRYATTVIQREQRSSTVIGEGIALPHGDPQLVKHSVISCVTLKEPIQWGESKVSLVCMLALKPKDIKGEEAKGFFQFIHQVSEEKALLEQLITETNQMQFIQDFSLNKK